MDIEVGMKRSNVNSHKINIIKQAIRVGDEYINYKGKSVEKKTTGPTKSQLVTFTCYINSNNVTHFSQFIFKPYFLIQKERF